ncbi:MAG TPA: DUF3426 domain-containing protein [Deltaproteobacteria bacterium]|nr:DUF3426 domain-containing protein [Deltaproteobacteria bacterium]
MIIQCDRCNTKFRLDDSKVTGKGVKVRCTKCQNVFVVTPPEPTQPAPPPVPAPQEQETAREEQPPRPEEPPKPSEPEAPKAEEGAKGEAAPPSPEGGSDLDLGGLDFDFGEDRTGDEAEKTAFGLEPAVDSTPAAAQQGAGEIGEMGLDFGGEPEEKAAEEQDMGLSLGEDEAGEESASAEREEEFSLDFDLGGAQEGEEGDKTLFGLESPAEAASSTGEQDAALGEMDLDFGEEPEEKAAEEQGIGLSLDEDEAGEETAPAEGEEERADEFDFSFDREEAAETEVTSFAAAKGEEEQEESTLFSEDFPLGDEAAATAPAQEAPPEGTEEAQQPETAAEPKAKSGLMGLAAAAVVAAAAAAIYFSGALDGVMKGLAGRPQQQAQAAVVEIEDIKGYMADNIHFGRLFVVESVIKNVSFDPQKIRGVKASLYNRNGERIAARMVSPGRIMSGEELKTLTRDEIERHFGDKSAGTIPPKGVIPAMVVFTEPPADMAAFDIEVLR